MKKFMIIISLLGWLTSCADEETIIYGSNNCDTNATIIDMTGLDGCGYMFKLDNGSILNPIRPVIHCGTPPLPPEITNDPLFNFEFVDGKRVKIGFYKDDIANICMSGTTVKITCIEEMTESNFNN